MAKIKLKRKLRQVKEKPKVSKFYVEDPVTLPKFIDDKLDRELKHDLVGELQEKMKIIEVDIKFGETMSAAGPLSFQQGISGNFNPQNIPFEDIQKMRKDSQVAAGLAFIKMPILAQNYSIMCQDPVIKAFVGQTLRPLYRRLIRSMLLAIDFGFSPHEKVFKREVVKIMNEGTDSGMEAEGLFQGDATS